MLLHLISI